MIIKKTIRQEIINLRNYHVQTAKGLVKLDAMENPYTLSQNLTEKLGEILSKTALNRYPTPSYKELKSLICKKMNVPKNFDIILGNGSDELISMISLACAKEGSKVIAPTPCFVMYELCAKLSKMDFIGIPLKTDFSINVEEMHSAIKTLKPTLIYIAFPNNPTGNLFNYSDVLNIIDMVKGSAIVVLDEAYHPFAKSTFMESLKDYDNLIIMRTFSKLGLAGIRLGYISSSKELLYEIEKVRPPYNINVLTETAAKFLLSNSGELEMQAIKICEERERLSKLLKKFDGIEVFPSSANFILIKIIKKNLTSDVIFERLIDKKILVKNLSKMHLLLKNCLRVTIGNKSENDIFYDALNLILND